MYIVGLTGGIASGKSTVARRLIERGAVHIDADQLSRVAVERGTPGLAAVGEAFGPAVLTADGSLDRAALGSIVFADESARHRLEAIVHPIVHALTNERIRATAERDPAAVVVYDVPLLVEAKRELDFDLIVVCHAPRDVRIERLVRNRGLTRPEAESRVAAQASDEQRLAVADVVLDTALPLEQTLAQVDELWQGWTARARERASASGS